MLNLLVNPIAGGKNGSVMLKKLALIEERLKSRKATFNIFKTQCRGDATKITEKLIADGADNVIVVGGDGTLHETINGFSNFDKVALGIIPCGTGNDFASALKIPEDPVKATDVILDETPKYTDFMQMPTVRGLNIIGTGVDVEVLKLYAASKKKTKLTYTKCLLKALAKCKFVQFDAQIDNAEKESYDSFIACVANGHRYGGGIPICPPASPCDGNLDFVAVKGMNKLKIAFSLLKLKTGKLMTMKETTHKLMQSVKILPKKQNYTVNVDGELYENIPFEVSIISNTLRVFRK